MSSHKLSLKAAILININIMLGAGLFINTTVLAHKVGMGGALSYALIGLLMLPLILGIMQLLKIHPEGGFYAFGKEEIHPYAGFLSAWSYATAKLASTVILIHSSVLFLQNIFPQLAGIPSIRLDFGLISFFIALNMLDIRTNNNIQRVFFVLKLIPVFFGILVGLFLWFGNTQAALPMIWEGMPGTIPLVLFAISGFEAACSLSSKIENSSQNAPRAIMISYFTVIAMNILFQLIVSGALGNLITSFANYTYVFPGLMSLMPSVSATTSHIIVSIMHLAIVSSALASGYGIVFSNTWNWHLLAAHKHLFGSDKITQLNRFNTPWICVLIQGIICILYLAITQGRQLPLQQTSVLGVTISYTVSIIALLIAQQRRTDLTISKWVPFLAFGNCLILLCVITYSLMNDGIYALSLFTGLLTLGTLMFFNTPGRLTIDELK